MEKLIVMLMFMLPLAGMTQFLKLGNRLVFSKEYHGTTTQMQRMFPNSTPVARVIYQGNDFQYGTDPDTGRRILLKHEQKLENMDNDFVERTCTSPARTYSPLTFMCPYCSSETDRGNLSDKVEK